MKPIYWRDNVLVVIDQTKLPAVEDYLEINNYQDVAEAIKKLIVRGAPLIGVAAAYGMVLAARTSRTATRENMLADLETAKLVLDSTRPTAVNLTKSTDRIMKAVSGKQSSDAILKAAEKEARKLFLETEQADLALSHVGSELVEDGDTILTICNTGALATGAYGTAFGVIRASYEAGKEIKVLACETRPLLQGARLTMWELGRSGIQATLIVDSAAGHYMRRGLVDKVITGADRIAANGDTANKIGTYTLAVLAARHGKPFYVAAPVSTVDMKIPGGEYIPVEERSPNEIKFFAGVRIAPEDAEANNPAFDITPASLITGIITDGGIVYPPYKKGLASIAQIKDA